MCTVCDQWSGTAYTIWGQACSELERLHALTSLLPSPFRERHTSLLRQLPWDSDRVNETLRAFMAHPPAERLQSREWAQSILEKFLGSARVRPSSTPLWVQPEKGAGVWIESPFSTFYSLWAQLVSEGEAWRDSLRAMVDNVQAALNSQSMLSMPGMGQAPQSPMLEASHQRQMQSMSAMQRMYADWERIIQDMEAQNRELGEREIDFRSGRHVIDLRLRRP